MSDPRYLFYRLFLYFLYQSYLCEHPGHIFCEPVLSVHCGEPETRTLNVFLPRPARQTVNTAPLNLPTSCPPNPRELTRKGHSRWTREPTWKVFRISYTVGPPRAVPSRFQKPYSTVEVHSTKYAKKDCRASFLDVILNNNSFHLPVPLQTIPQFLNRWMYTTSHGPART